MRRTGFISHPLCKLHVQSDDHPECPERLNSIDAELKKRKLLDYLEILQPSECHSVDLERIHSKSYIKKVEQICDSGGGWLDNGDTRACSISNDAARMAASASLLAADAVMKGQLNNAFCAIRPPGHHALASNAMGFCIFNNVAVVASYLKSKFGLDRILILDFDVHHGNGTQDIFYEDPQVFFFSTHQHPFYPGTGAAHEIGAGMGEGYTLNVPLPAYSTGAKILTAIEGSLYSAMQCYKPQFILLSSGFDAHMLDPVGGMQVSGSEFRQINQAILKIADEFCEGRMISLLEGGYNTEILGGLVADQLEDFLE